MRFLTKGRSPSSRPIRYAPRPRLEELESRVVPYVTTGNAWPTPALVTLSFIPDGTLMTGSSTSNLFATLNARYSTTTWQNQFLKAAQTWAQQANLNFSFVTDNGTQTGWGDYQQGDPGMGDIRIGGYDFGDPTALASAYLPPPVNNFSVAGDITLNTGVYWTIGGYPGYDPYTVAIHEIGHAIGLAHSADSLANMWPSYVGKALGLATDDISGVQAIYGARPADSANNSFANATDLTSQIDPTALTAVVNNQNLNNVNSADYFKFTTPANTSSTIKVQVQTKGLSLMTPTLTVYASNQTTVVGSANGGTQLGAIITVTLSNVTAGTTYYVKVKGTNSANMANDGVYALSLNLGTGSWPTVTVPNTMLANGNPLHSGNGGFETADGPGQQVDVFNVNEGRNSQTAAAAAPTTAAPTLPTIPLAALVTPMTVVATPAPTQGFEVHSITATPAPAVVSNATATASVAFVSGATTDSIIAAPEVVPLPAALLEGGDGGAVVPAGPVAPDPKPAAAPFASVDFAVWHEPCDRLFANPAAVERMQIVDSPAVTTETAHDVSLAMILDDGEGSAENTALLLPMAAFLMVNLQRRPLDRSRRGWYLPEVVKE